MRYIPRLIEPFLRSCLEDTPVVIVTGPRQAGKTTLVQHLMETGTSAAARGSYITLDDANILNIARQDPIGLLRSQSRPVIIDEIQCAPELIRTVKLLVDEERQPGSFILTGSADLMSLPTLADSLAGRAEFVTLYPFNLEELAKQDLSGMSYITNGVFRPQFWRDLPQQIPVTAVEGMDITSIIQQGGYPEPLNRAPQRRASWHKSYIKAIIQRDITAVVQLKKLDELEQLLQLLAGLSSETLNYARLANAVQMDIKTVQKYICALENLYIIRRIPGWHRNELKRVIKQPKLHFVDTGLLCALRSIKQADLQSNPNLMGSLMETWVCSELLKGIAADDTDLRLFHYRDSDKREVDFIITDGRDRATGIEIKSGMTINASMFAALNKLIASGSIQQGIILYNGDRVLPYSDQLAAIPAQLFFNSRYKLS